MKNHDKREIQEAFFGRIIKDVSVVVLTPIHHLYVALFDNLHCGKESLEGFYRNACFKKGEKKGLLICCPQGVAAQDVVFLFPNTQMIFVGYAGGMTDDILIGTPVEAEKAIFSSSEIYKLVCPGFFSKAIVSYSPCFLGKIANNAYSFAHNNGASVVDMETVHCARAAEDNNVRLTAFLLVTDIPNHTDVWHVDQFDKENIRKGFCLIQNSLNEMI